MPACIGLARTHADAQNAFEIFKRREALLNRRVDLLERDIFAPAYDNLAFIAHIALSLRSRINTLRLSVPSLVRFYYFLLPILV